MTEASESPAPVAAEPLPSVGERLLQARQSQGLSLGEMARQLKLSVKQVEALERNDYSSFPGPLWVRGFLRNYAKVLGLDAAALVHRAGLTPEATSGESPASSVPSAPTSVGKERRRVVLLILAFIVLGLLVLGLLGQRAGNQTNGSAPVLEPTPAASPAATAPVPAASTPVVGNASIPDGTATPDAAASLPMAGDTPTLPDGAGTPGTAAVVSPGQSIPPGVAAVPSVGSPSVSASGAGAAPVVSPPPGGTNTLSTTTIPLTVLPGPSASTSPAATPATAPGTAAAGAVQKPETSRAVSSASPPAATSPAAVPVKPAITGQIAGQTAGQPASPPARPVATPAPAAVAAGPRASSPEPAVTSASPAGDGALPVAAPNVPAPGATAEPGATALPAAEPVKPRTIRFSFTQSVDVRVIDAEGKVLLGSLQAAGSEKSVRGMPPFSVSVGNVHALKIVYRGREVDLTSRGRTGASRVTLK